LGGLGIPEGGREGRRERKKEEVIPGSFMNGPSVTE